MFFGRPPTAPVFRAALPATASSSQRVSHGVASLHPHSHRTHAFFFPGFRWPSHGFPITHTCTQSATHTSLHVPCLSSIHPRPCLISHTAMSLGVTHIQVTFGRPHTRQHHHRPFHHAAHGSQVALSGLVVSRHSVACTVHSRPAIFHPCPTDLPTRLVGGHRPRPTVTVPHMRMRRILHHSSPQSQPTACRHLVHHHPIPHATHSANRWHAKQGTSCLLSVKQPARPSPHPCRLSCKFPHHPTHTSVPGTHSFGPKSGSIISTETRPTSGRTRANHHNFIFIWGKAVPPKNFPKTHLGILDRKNPRENRQVTLLIHIYPGTTTGYYITQGP